MLISYCLAIVLACEFNGSQEPEIAAIVNGYVLSVNRVDRYLSNTLNGKKLDGLALAVARYEAANHLVNRHLIFEAIADKTKIGDPQVVYELSKFEDRLAELNQTLKQYLSDNKLSRNELMYEIRWRLAWGKYLKKNLTQERLESYFKKYRRKFDGTKMHVAHILFSDSEPSMQQASVVREKIIAGEISWNDAAQKCSIATTSADNGGEIGWITYHGPMVPEFCKAAMKLQQDQISNPLKTNFGIHLIKCLAIEPGTLDAKSVDKKLRADATNYLFNSIADKNRSNAKIDVRLENPIKPTNKP